MCVLVDDTICHHAPEYKPPSLAQVANATFKRSGNALFFFSPILKKIKIKYWVSTWGRGFRCGASVVCFSFKNAVRAA
jgi:hypothetical protein